MAELITGASGLTLAEMRDEHGEYHRRHVAPGEREAAEDAYYESRRTGRWFDPATGWSVDASPYDAPPREPLPEGLTDRQRWEADAGNPMILVTVACHGCGAQGTYYGRADHFPDDPRCAACLPSAEP